MSERITIYGNKVNLTNTMADGVVLEDMEGFKLPYCEKTKGFYTTLAHIAMAAAKRQVEQQEMADKLNNENIIEEKANEQAKKLFQEPQS